MRPLQSRIWWDFAPLWMMVSIIYTTSCVVRIILRLPAASMFLGRRQRSRERVEKPMAELRLDGRVALVTGAGRGLGRSYVKLLAARGASVVVNDPGVGLRGEGGNEAPAESVAEEICAGGGRALASFDSVASEAGAAAAVARAVDGFGRIDIIVNNAGIFMPERDFLETSSESFKRLWQVHVMGTINIARAAWPHLLAQSFGRIINTTSHVGYLGCRGLLEYSVAKAARHRLTPSLALEAEGSGIVVNAVAPGAMTRPV